MPYDTIGTLDHNALDTVHGHHGNSLSQRQVNRLFLVASPVVAAALVP